MAGPLHEALNAFVISRLYLSNCMHNQTVLEVLKLTIKFTLNAHTCFGLLLCFAKVIIIKIVS